MCKKKKALWDYKSPFQTPTPPNAKIEKKPLKQSVPVCIYGRICTLSSSSDSCRVNVQALNQWAQSPSHNGQRKPRGGEDEARINPSFHFHRPPNLLADQHRGNQPRKRPRRGGAFGFGGGAVIQVMRATMAVAAHHRALSHAVSYLV